MELDINTGFSVVFDVINKQVGPGVIDNPCAICLGRTAVIGILMRVALNVLTGRKTGVDITDTLMVRNKIDTFTDPHRCREITIHGCERLKLSVPFNVYPELSCCAAAVAFPACGFSCQSAEDNTTSLTEINMIRGTVRQTLRFTTVCADFPYPRIKSQPSTTRIENGLTIGIPIDDSSIAALISESLRLTAKCRHHINF